VAVLIINGIQPGPNVISKNPELFWGLIASMWIGNLILVVLNIPLVRIWVSVLHIPREILYPMIIIISLVGTYSINNSWFDLVLLGLFGLLGLMTRLLKFEPAPLALAFVITPMFEEYSRRALTISRGDFMIFFERPISLGFIILASMALISVFVYNRRKQ